MTDLERIKQFHDWLGDTYNIETELDAVKVRLYRLSDYYDLDSILTVYYEGWHNTEYLFKKEKLITHWITE